MFERDYLMNQVLQLARFLAQALQRRQAGQPLPAEELDTAIVSLTGLPLDALLHLPLRTLLTTLEPAADPEWTRTRLVARLLAERSHLTEVGSAARRAFMLLDEVSRRAPEAMSTEDEAALNELLARLG